ncbi:MAG: hypothetical protein AAF208_14905 [Cyanobacteria bacterium P01_A01_bin.45]
MLLLLYKYIFEYYLLQSWIIQQNILPTEAAKHGRDKANCGDCPLKLSNIGSCYVNLLPINNIYRKYKAGGYSKLDKHEIEIIKRYRYPIRIGSYGDPTAVPFHVWEPIISASDKYTGYTHLWRNQSNYIWRKYLMASVENKSDARLAQSLGWRSFRVIAPDAPLSKNEILCRHTEDDRIVCETCLLCDGASSKPNIADRVNGLNWKISNFIKYSKSLPN